MGADFLLKNPDVYSGLPGHLNRRPFLKPSQPCPFARIQYPFLLFHFDHFILGHKERERDFSFVSAVPASLKTVCLNELCLGALKQH